MSFPMSSASMLSLPANHFLARAPPPSTSCLPSTTIDTSTLAAHDFDVDARTGFMPPQPPLARLPPQWEAWEAAMHDAIERGLQLGAKEDVTSADENESAAWRERVRKMPIISTDELKGERTLRRAHHVLAWLLHFYVHTLPPTSPILIPSTISTPLLQICRILLLPPVLTYSDDVLYNWYLSPGTIHPTPEDIRIQTTFTQTRDEEEFYLASARIELHGVRCLSLMSSIADEAFVADSLALQRITTALHALSTAVDTLTSAMLSVQEGCDPEVFYHQIRPWFKGEDSSSAHRKWIFEGAQEDDEWTRELSGPSAGQSALIHALDIFLGVAEHTHGSGVTGKTESESKPFLERMQMYMPRHHRAFLFHLAESPAPLRELVQDVREIGLSAAYDGAVRALKRFRDAHMKVVAIYVVGPARREEKARREAEGELKGTGGTELVRFLRMVRDRTAAAVLGASQ